MTKPKIKPSNEVYEIVKKHLNHIKRDYYTSNFGYASWNPPNTTITISDDLVSMLAKMNGEVSTFFLADCVMRLKRNPDPIYASLIHLKYDEAVFNFSKRTFFRRIKALKELNLLIPTTRDFYIVNPSYCHKLYKPKFDEDVI